MVVVKQISSNAESCQLAAWLSRADPFNQFTFNHMITLVKDILNTKYLHTTETDIQNILRVKV